jgi:5-(carboxyamino)imidazole ribonucleotide synthase
VTFAVIEPGAVLGVLGGGQLGALFTTAARRLGYQVAVWDPDPDAPAHGLAQRSFSAPFTDQTTLEQFRSLASAVTYEWENVPIDLCETLQAAKPVRPSSAVLRIIQDRLEQKGFLAARGLPVPSFLPLTTPDQLPAVVGKIGYPTLVKTATAGYDGKGQWRITDASDVEVIQRALHDSARPGIRWIVEGLVSFERELSILVIRGMDGQTRVYPLAENQHEEGILRTTCVPAPVSSEIAARAASLAVQVVEALHGVGVFCLELFHLPTGELLINEIAPRPHNSGHYTLDACSVSQFEQQVRALCGLPLGEVQLLNAAAMVNLIGDDVNTIMNKPDCRALLDLTGTFLHLYGKRTIRPRRKMGHVTFLADSLNVARERAQRLSRGLASGLNT